ncbi:MAG: GNAT family N-acetyltransferase [Victivallales bacterium]|nr:GNAT family N-acetyltransferase [Victivallales bacterium]
MSVNSNSRVVHWCSQEKASTEIVRYMLSSIGYESYRCSPGDQSYWRLYYREALAGNFYPETVDHLFLAELDGRFAARIWFAYNSGTGHGNFGNVFTEPEFRKRGLMNELLAPCIKAFRDSPARRLCCASGNKFAVASYLNAGFKLIYGGECGPLTLTKDGDYLEETKRAFAGKTIAAVRAGTIGDQFECDKYLYYTENIYQGKRHFRRGPAGWISDYRGAYQEMLSGNGTVYVAENTTGTVVGYAFALNVQGNSILDFTLHSAYINTAEKLLKATVSAYREKFTEPLLFYTFEDDREKIAALTGTSAVKVGELPCSAGKMFVYNF